MDDCASDASSTNGGTIILLSEEDIWGAIHAVESAWRRERANGTRPIPRGVKLLAVDGAKRTRISAERRIFDGAPHIPVPMPLGIVTGHLGWPRDIPLLNGHGVPNDIERDTRPEMRSKPAYYNASLVRSVERPAAKHTMMTIADR